MQKRLKNLQNRSARNNWISTALFGAAVFCTVALSPVYGQATNPAIQAAQQAGSQFTPKFNSKDAINQNAIDPLQGKTQMVAPDGTAFDASIQCSTSTPLVSVFAAPGPTGDLQSLIVGADLDLDGTFDINVNPAFEVSGICSNGVISCDSGTWDNCKGYKWTGTATTLDLVQTPINNNLSGCYCINQSCGSSLVWSNISLITRDIGAGAVKEIQNTHPDYVISSVKSDTALSEFYGASGTGCRQGTTGQDQYLKTPLGLEAAVQTEGVNQSSDPNSMYSIIKGSSAAAMYDKTLDSCTMTRTVTATDNPCTLEPEVITNDCQLLEADPKCEIKEEIVDGVTTIQDFQSTGLLPLQQTRTIESPNNNGGTSTQANLMIWRSGNLFLKASTTPCGVNGCVCTGWTFGCTTYTPYTYPYTYTQEVTNVTPETLVVRIKGIASNVIVRAGVATNEYFADQCYKVTKILSDVSAQEEVYEIKKIIPYPDLPPQQPYPGGTYIDRPLDYCLNVKIVLIQFTASIQYMCQFDVTKPWWTKQRIYECKTTNISFDFSDAKVRADAATTTADLTGGFENKSKDANGNWVSQQIGIGEPAELPVVESCQKVCKVYKEVPDDRVTATTNAAGVKVTPLKKVYRYPSCADNVCPTEAGETIVKDCQCLNDFAEAATIMQTVRLAGQDITCLP